MFTQMNSILLCFSLLLIGCSKVEHANGQSRSSGKPVPSEIKSLMGPATIKSLVADLQSTALCQQVYGIGATHLAALAVPDSSRNPLNDFRAFEAELAKVSIGAASGGTPYNPCGDRTGVVQSLWRASAFDLMGNILAAVIPDLLKACRRSDVEALTVQAKGLASQHRMLVEGQKSSDRQA